MRSRCIVSCARSSRSGWNWPNATGRRCRRRHPGPVSLGRSPTPWPRHHMTRRRRNTVSEESERVWGVLLSLWWGRFVVALIMFVVAWILYSYLTSVEEVTGQGRLPWYLSIVYNLVGKRGTFLLFVIPGVVFTLMGISSLVERLRG